MEQKEFLKLLEMFDNNKNISLAFAMCKAQLNNLSNKYIYLLKEKLIASAYYFDNLLEEFAQEFLELMYLIYKKENESITD